MDRLTFCRENLDKLNEDELILIYNQLTLEYADEEQVFNNKMENIRNIFGLMWDYDLEWNDWFTSIINKKYIPTEKYIGIGREGIYSYEDCEEFKWFINKKMNGEAMELIEEYLQQKDIKNED